MPSFLACARRYNISPEDMVEIRAHIDSVGDDALGVQSYLETLSRELDDLQQGLADEGVFVDFGRDTPPPNLMQDLQASIRSARSALSNRPPDILSAVRQFGGIKPGFDGGELKAAMDTKYMQVVRKDGLDPGDMRSMLAQMGYLEDGATVEEMYDVLRRASDGEYVFSRQEFGQEIEAYEAALAFEDELARNGLDISDVTAEDLIGLETNLARNQEATGAKAKEAGRSAGKAANVEEGAGGRLVKIFERLAEADARMTELNEVVAPKVRDEIRGARNAQIELLPKLKDAKKARSQDEWLANLDELSLREVIDDAVGNIIGLKAGEHHMHSALSSPTRRRVLNVPDEVLQPWLVTDVGMVVGHYFNKVIPDIELARAGLGPDGWLEMERKVIDEARAKASQAKTKKEKEYHLFEAERRLKDLRGMRDRHKGTFAVPDDPKDIAVRASRAVRTLSYTGYLGQMVLSAAPDIANVIGRNGLEAALGVFTAITDPKRLALAAKDASEFGGAAEWHLSSRANSIADVIDPYGENSMFERAIGQTGRAFSIATGMIPWNVAWKSVGGAFVASKMSKAAMAVKSGKATKKQIAQLAEARIEPWMAERIADQIEQFGDMDGPNWLPQAGRWTDEEARKAFLYAYNHEVDIMIVTPGQDKPLWFSTPIGATIFQFKSFGMSAYHRILLSGIQRHDAAFLMQVAAAVALGGLVSNLKADLGGYERKEGAAWWEDAINRSGVGGWLFDAQGVGNVLTGGRMSFSGEVPSRFASQSKMGSLAGPSFNMTQGVLNAMSSAAKGELSAREAKDLLRPVPGNNLPYFMGITSRVADALSDMNKN